MQALAGGEEGGWTGDVQDITVCAGCEAEFSYGGVSEATGSG